MENTNLKRLAAMCAAAASLSTFALAGSAMAVETPTTSDTGTASITLNAAQGNTLTGHTFDFYRLGSYGDITANGGNGSMDSRNQESGSTVTVADNGFTCDGYTFTGWNTSPNGTGTDYKPGDALTVTADTTLYAQWKRVPETTLPDTGGSGHTSHAPSAISGLAMASAAALSISAHRRRHGHANPPV